VQVLKAGSRHIDKFVAGYRGSRGRAVVSFEYVAPEDCESRLAE
jgi:hypothetical protein